MFSNLEEDKDSTLVRNGNNYGFDNSGKSNGQCTRQKTDLASSHFKQALENIEENLNQKIDKLYEHESIETGSTKKILEINELRAELAELRADIRGLRQYLAEETSKSDHASHGQQ